MIGIFSNFQYLISPTSGATGTEFSHLITSPNSSSATSIHQVMILLGAHTSLDSQDHFREETKLSKNRDLIQETITQNPGITLREIQRETDLALGVIQYHLYNLELKEMTIESMKLGRCRHFFDRSAHYSIKEKSWLALTRNPKIAAILTHISNNNGICLQKDLVAFTGHSRALISYYVTNLRKQGLIKVEENQLHIVEDYLAISDLVPLRD
ncbi:MAG: winged helix-turn-helix transcriptional regulator [Candidatus Heimdallarchaeota archaeon]